MILVIRSPKLGFELRFWISRRIVKYQGYRSDYEGERISFSGMDVHRDPSSLRHRSLTSRIGASASSSFELWMEQADVEHPQFWEEEQNRGEVETTKGDEEEGWTRRFNIDVSLRERDFQSNAMSR